MTDLLLAEELFLLTHDDESGKAASVVAVDAGYAGAVLLDLALAGLLTMDGKLMRALPGSAQHPFLAAAHDRIAREPKQRKPDYWIRKLQPDLKPIGRRIGQSLVERGVLTEQHSTVLGLFKTTTWPEADPAPERELRARLAQVLGQGTTPTPHQALLIALLSALNQADRLVDKPLRKQARKRAKEIAESTVEGAGVSSAVSKAVQAVQAAVLAAVMVPVMVPVIASS